MRRFLQVGCFRAVGGLNARIIAPAAALATHWAAATAWAQRPAHAPEDEETLIRWGIAAGIVFVIGLTAFLNPKRSHLS